jgi:hypothetical protein
MNLSDTKSQFLSVIAFLVCALFTSYALHEHLEAANVTESRLSQGNNKTEKVSRLLSEVQFNITDALVGNARLFAEKVEETVLPEVYGCQAPQGGKEVQGKFRLEFEIGEKLVATYLLDFSFVEGTLWDPVLKRSNLPLTGHSKQQIVIIQYETCNTIVALIFGYDLQRKEMARYSFTDSGPWRVSLSIGTGFLTDGSVAVLTPGKPDGVLQKEIYNNAVWGTFLDRYSFDPPTRMFLKIPMVIGMRIHLVTPGRSTTTELVLYEDGYLTDRVGAEKFVPKIEVFKLLDSEAAKGVLQLREKSGRWLESEFGGDSPLYDFFFNINNKRFAARCGQTICPKEIQFIKNKLLQFWREDLRR